MEAVYIFENRKAKLIKVGITHLWTTSVEDRLMDLNNQYLGKKATCQICGYKRFVWSKGLINSHVISGTRCPGGNKIPLEKDITLAQNYLDSLRVKQSSAFGSEKGSITRKINTIERRIKIFEKQEVLVGKFSINTIFYTESAEIVEQLSHKILADNFFKYSRLGEVFHCSVLDALEAVESALNQLGLTHDSEKTTKITE